MHRHLQPRIQRLLNALLRVLRMRAELVGHYARVVVVHLARNGVNLLPRLRRYGNGLDGADALRTSGQAGVGCGRAFRVALAGVVEELLGNRVFQCAHVLPPQAVVGNPFGFLVVAAPGNLAHVSDVDVDARECDFADDAPAVDGIDQRMQQTVAHGGSFHHVGAALAQARVAFGGGKPAPQCGGEQVAGDLLARQARQRRGVAALRALQGGLRAAQPTLELAQLTRPDACGADADGRGLSDRVAGIGGDVPLSAVVELGEPARTLQGGAHGQRLAAGGDRLAFEIDLGFEVDEVARQTGWQFAGLDGAAVGVGLGQVAGDEVSVGLGGGDIAQGQAFAD